MSHPFTLVPMLQADQLPDDVVDWCLDHEYNLHDVDDIAIIFLDGNPMFNWLTEQGYEFPLDAVMAGYGYVAIKGS